MKFIGVELRVPSSREMFGATAFILFIVVAVLGLHHFGQIGSNQVFTTIAAFSFGVILNSFGVSISRYGWRALLVLALFATALAGVFRLLGF